MALVNRSGSGPSTWALSLPVMGCPPTKPTRGGSRWAHSTTCALVLPVSVTTAPSGSRLPTSRSTASTARTGVATITSSAPSTALAGLRAARSNARMLWAARRRCGSRSKPTTVGGRGSRRSAMPSEAPISPRPMIATCRGGFIISPEHDQLCEIGDDRAQDTAQDIRTPQGRQEHEQEQEHRSVLPQRLELVGERLGQESADEAEAI